MRLTAEELKEITGLQQQTAQLRWFKQHFNLLLACDRNGPILTRSAFEGLVARRYGLNQSPAESPRPTVRLRETA